MLKPLVAAMLAAVSLVAVATPSHACDLECPAGTVCGLAPGGCEIPGCEPGEDCSETEPVCTEEEESCVPAPCNDASECPDGFTCEDQDAACWMDSDGNTGCEEGGQKECVPPAEPDDGTAESAGIVRDSAGSSSAVQESIEGAGEPSAAAGCSMGAGTVPSGGALSLLALGVLARRRRR